MKCGCCNQNPCTCGATEPAQADSADFVQSGPAPNEGYDKALALLRRVSTPDGFVASATERTNYRRVWGRDGVITGLAALLCEDTQLVSTFKQTLLTLASHQGPHGEIPSNVDKASGRVSYGGTTGRLDADLWFAIGCAEYWVASRDEKFLEEMLPVLKKVDFLLRAWEFNNRGLLFVPPAGDWADEYIQSGYVLYDQLLYLQAQRSLAALHQANGDSRKTVYHEQRARQLKTLIQANYWFKGVDEPPDAIYHEVLYRKGYESPHCHCRYWMPFFSPHGYGYRFDAFANVLVSLLDVADDSRRERVDRFISELVSGRPRLLPAFRPVIEPVDDDWERLQVTYSYTFRNQPYEYHNGGLWPMVTGFYVADLAARGKQDEAEQFSNGIHWANSLPLDEPWSFPEYVHGLNFTAGGTKQQAWSAAAAVIAHQAVQGKPLLQVKGSES